MIKEKNRISVDTNNIWYMNIQEDLEVLGIKEEQRGTPYWSPIPAAGEYVPIRNDLATKIAKGRISFIHV